MEEGDLIYLDSPGRKLEIVGIHGERRTAEEVEKILAQRKAKWVPKESKYPSGILNIYSKHAVSPMEGGYMK